MSSARDRRIASPSPRGATLIELIVSFFLMSLLLLVTYQLLTPGLRAWSASNLRSQVENQALVGIQRISRDVQNSCIDSITPFEETTLDGETGRNERLDRLSLLNPYDRGGQIRQQSNGPVLWASYRVFYVRHDTHELYCGERPLEYQASVLQNRLESFGPAPEDRVIARYVRALSIERTKDDFCVLPPPVTDSPDQWTNPVRVRIHVRHLSQEFRLETAVSALMVNY